MKKYIIKKMEDKIYELEQELENPKLTKDEIDIIKMKISNLSYDIDNL